MELWDIRTGECVNTLRGHTSGSVSSLSFSPDGKTIASGSSDYTVKIWDALTSECLKTLQGYTRGILSVSISPDGKTIASGSSDHTGHLSVDNRAQLIASNNGGKGNGGNIRVDAALLSLTGNSQLRASTQGEGDAGNIFISTRDRTSLDDGAIISNIVGTVSSPGRFGNGKGGLIRIDTGSLSVANGSQLQASTFGTGDAGDIIINARDSVIASGFGEFEDLTLPTAVFSVVAEDSRGNGGNIRINTGSVFVENGARFSVSTSGLGRAGNITIDARDSAVVDGVSRVGFASQLSTATEDDASGRGGTITVNTNSFRVSNGGFLDAQTTSAFGGGDVTINANNFEATQGGRIFTTATNQGQAGNITFNADTVNLSGTNGRSISGLFANTTSTASARGGNIQVNARKLDVSDRAQISVNSQGSGVAGDINIDAKRIELRDKGLNEQSYRKLR
ncbi:WD40 domain-containing protein [Brunnivagina elsteri]|uniref:Uncharacterized protein n=1 Tax=Brunnivagina elsteri CCALA 953 TaxID=987040 RepID=A0A2A2TF99_9CYAN|nr:hypothetical protein [Calothrix elsteri]PAX52393.1 hypothetical protein CK510_19570 [Calothrix elsteri CCALA 953]